MLAELKSRDARTLQETAERLAKAPPEEKPADIAKALAPLLKHDNDWVKGAASKALVVWATPEVETELIAASTSENVWVRAAVIEALGKVKTTKAAEAVAAQMYRNRGEASKALKAMGPVAEAATINCLKDRDFWARKEACSILSDIGGEKAVKALTDYASRATGFDRQDADKAIDTIERRLRR